MNLRLGLVLALALAASAIGAQEGRRSVWNGVYTDEQAQNGQMQFQANCTGCHGADLGGRSAPALRGVQFVDDWREDRLGSLYRFIKNTMPPRATPVLDENGALAVVSYILQSNGVPAGSAELTATAVDNIQFEGPNGPAPLPDHALVQVVGCLAKGDREDSWRLVRASEPARTRNSGKSNSEELKSAGAQAQGAAEFQLQNLAMAGIISPDDKLGHKMLVRGALMRSSGGDRISITSLENLAASCEQ